MLTVLLTIVHVVVCFVLIMVVLLQTGKRADLAGAFGGGGSQTAFGARGAATFLSRMTAWCAVIFMGTSMSLAILYTANRGGGSVLDTAPDAGQRPSSAPSRAPGGTPRPGSVPGSPESAPSPGGPDAPANAPPAGAPAPPVPSAPSGGAAPAGGQNQSGSPAPSKGKAPAGSRAPSAGQTPQGSKAPPSGK